MLQAKYVDRLLGRFMADLRRRDLFDRSLIVLMADHGVSFRAGDFRRRVSQNNFADLASIPLFIKRPGQRRGRVDESPATSVDVLPTIADLLGAELPWKSDGRSLRGGPAPPRRTVRVGASEGPDLRRSFAEFTRQRDAFVGQLVRLFGSGDQSLYAPPAQDGFDRALNEPSQIVRRPGAQVRLDSTRSFQSVDPTAPLVPVFVTGQVSGIGVGEQLAVAVNGRVAATTYTFEEGGQTAFSAVVAPQSFRRGANSVQVLAVRGSGAQLALESLGKAASLGLDLVYEDGRELLKGKSGTEAQVVPGAVGGYLDAVERFPGGVTIRGWAAEKGRVADRVVVYLNRRLLAEGRPAKRRDDVAADLGRRARSSGFALAGRVPAGVAASALDIRAFALFGERAAELTKPPNMR